MLRSGKFLIYLLVSILGLGGIFWGKIQPAPNSQDQDLLLLPHARSSVLLSLGHHEVLAGLLWMKSVVYYGDNILSGRDAKWMLQMMDVITTLDSNFLPAYQLTGTVLNSSDEQDLKILQRGIQHFPEEWRLRLFYAFKVIEKYQDYPRAAAILKPLSTDPNPKIPPHIRTLNQTIASYGLPREIAIADALQNYMSQGQLFHLRNRATLARRIFYSGNFLYNMPTEAELKSVQAVLDLCQNQPLEPQNCLSQLISLKTQKN